MKVPVEGIIGLEKVWPEPLFNLAHIRAQYGGHSNIRAAKMLSHISTFNVDAFIPTMYITLKKELYIDPKND